jgi:hypothetical protein
MADPSFGGGFGEFPDTWGGMGEPAPEEHEAAELGPPVTGYARVGADEQGVRALEPGLYLIDTNEAQWAQLWPILLELYGKEALRELFIEPSRDWVLATFYVGKPSTFTLAVPLYRITPDDATLWGIARRSGYEGIMAPVGILEWASKNFPAAYQTVINVAQTVADVGSGLNRTVGIATALVLGYLLIKRR